MKPSPGSWSDYICKSLFQRVILKPFDFHPPKKKYATAEQRRLHISVSGNNQQGGRQVDTGTYDADKLERLRLSELALQR